MAVFSAALCVLYSPDAAAKAKVKMTGGDLSAFSTAQSVQVEFVYDGMMVGSMTEEAYVNKTVTERNTKEAGSGDSWLQKWRSDREGRFHPKYVKLMNQELSERSITFATAADAATLSMVVEVVRTEPGFYSYVVNRPAEVDFDVRVTATSDPSVTLAEFTVRRAPGVSVTSMMDTGERISEAYAKAGKDLGRYINKKAP